VRLSGIGEAMVSPVALGVVLGLVVGKMLGITTFSMVAVRLGLAALPSGVTWRTLHGAAWLGGIGFTMSLFVAGLAFADASLLDQAKIAVLGASTVAGIVGFVILRQSPVPASSEEGMPDEGASSSAGAASG